MSATKRTSNDVWSTVTDKKRKRLKPIGSSKIKTVFMVAEKPSVAKSLAKILSNGSAIARKGLYGTSAVHEYTGKFMDQNVKFKVTSVYGHIMTIAFHKSKFTSWSGNPVDLFWAPIEKTEAEPKLKIPRFLAKEAKGSDYLVLWLDCDREGENICFEVIDAVQNVMSSSGNGKQTIFRAQFSAITDQDISNAMANLGSPNKNEAMSVDARHELDLRIGWAFTRFQTKYFQERYSSLAGTAISYGPCQIPTLGFCVKRHDEIKLFKPKPYWVLQVQIEGLNGKTIKIDWDQIRVFDKQLAQTTFNNVKLHNSAIIISVNKKQKLKQCPPALNTVELMRVASSALDMAPHHTMMVADKLYTQGYISYPRTETTTYPENFDLLGTLRQQVVSKDWGNVVSALLESGIQKPREGHDAGDHPPITPLKFASEVDVGSEAWKLYEYITKHFIATLSPDCQFLQTTITFSIGTEKFTLVGKEVTDPGYTELMTRQAIPTEETLPPFEINDSCPLRDIKLLERTTKPPNYLTESEVITLMEKHGIGTDASIPVHINKIGQRNYVTIGTGRRLVPTPLGIALTHGYQKIDLELVEPHMRSAMEKQLNLIAQGKAEFQAVLQKVLETSKLKFQHFVSRIAEMNELFEMAELHHAPTQVQHQPTAASTITRGRGRGKSIKGRQAKPKSNKKAQRDSTVFALQAHHQLAASVATRGRGQGKSRGRGCEKPKSKMAQNDTIGAPETELLLAPLKVQCKATTSSVARGRGCGRSRGRGRSKLLKG